MMSFGSNPAQQLVSKFVNHVRGSARPFSRKRWPDRRRKNGEKQATHLMFVQADGHAVCKYERHLHAAMPPFRMPTLRL